MLNWTSGCRSCLAVGLCSLLNLSFAAAAPRLPVSPPAAWLGAEVSAYAAATGAFEIDPADRETARLFYRTVFAASETVAADWNGDLANCIPGSVSDAYQQATIRRVNWFRAMAGVPADIALDAAFSVKAQQAALMMSSNEQLSHDPPGSWSCYSPDGAEAAGNSNLSLGNAGPDAVFSQFRDTGASNARVGHRRWILYPQTQRMGAGSVPGADGQWAANALWVFDEHAWDARPPVRDGLIAWPPPGYVPYQTLFPRWSLSYDDADFSSASVTMTHEGVPVAVQVEPYFEGYGENTLVWMPEPYQDGETWSRPDADEQYQVTVSDVIVDGASRDFVYEVTVFDPDVKGADYRPQTITGPSNLQLGSAAEFDFSSVAGATGYQWRLAGASLYRAYHDAESGLGDLEADDSSGYAVVTQERAASGAASFHFAHPRPPGDAVLTFAPTFVPRPGAQLVFSSWLGWATENQVATLEVSEDDGLSWSPLWELPGNDSAQAGGFAQTTVSLDDYAGRAIRLRFDYRYLGGIYYFQTHANAGWFIDDIELVEVDALSAGDPQSTDTDSSFTFVPAKAGSLLVQVRPLLFGDYPGEWSPVETLVVSGDTTTDRDSTDWRVAEIYVATLGYAPDHQGLQYWVDNIETLPKWTPETVAQSFFDQPLVQAQYPAEAGDEALIEALYRNLFGREVDSEGLAYWLDELGQGRMARNQMIIALINGGWANTSPEAQLDMLRFGNRIRVALAFAQYQADHGILYAELSAADRESLRQAGRDILLGVTSEADTREAAIAEIPSRLAALVD
ncbi:SCP-like extracellular protein [Thiorhodococcus drewsii AZ1]|uniref:SCP-like extracellular protein n=1 Tax=Thiorhodococcus drewsii AZ1 TaxID=765913 RepID=G2DYE9_9GAMM|nr:DUF4214 domain-containing protein [Thiorhodococcus drewsii]EGV32576.1 SCP-like extracellular protein [Thiorhodococcus drewsii AZ1]